MPYDANDAKRKIPEAHSGEWRGRTLADRSIIGPGSVRLCAAHGARFRAVAVAVAGFQRAHLRRP